MIYVKKDSLKKTTYEDAARRRHLHFLGIGGISMSTLALLAKRRGYTVTGYDRARTPLTESLEAEGIPVRYELHPEALTGDTAIVYTAAIHEDNSELAAGLALGLPCIPRAEYLGGIMQHYRRRVGVSGTHGKSSTTTMLYHIYEAAGADPTVACGAVIPALKAAYRIGGNDHFLYEACEYTDSFLHFSPTTAIILNIDLDHVDYFRDLAQMKDSFAKSIRSARILVANWDDENTREVSKGFGGWIIPVGIEREDVAYHAEQLVPLEGGGTRFRLYRGKDSLGLVTIHVPGRHNVTDALCAAAAAMENGISFTAVKKGLADFGGAKRRFEYRGSFGGAALYDDYAHHPTEIEATLKGARTLTKGRLFCVFQPHTYSRTAGLLDGFCQALSHCDQLVLAPIYAAREQNTFGVSSADIATRVAGGLYMEDLRDIAAFLKEKVKPGDLVITMGAGNICNLVPLLLEDGCTCEAGR